MGILICNYLISFVILFAFSGQALCAPPSLGLPIRCILGSTCFIQNYFDQDPGPGYQDYACGQLSYDGHTGTDFRLRDLAAMRTNVVVLAAAPGIVVGTRNGEPDISVNKRGKAALNGKEAGNGVRIDHGDGWTTQYSHMLQGSVRVQIGQRVDKGDVLGFVGLSGNTEFPHLHFSASKDGIPVDPFNPDRAACGTNPATLWSASDLPALRYQDTGLLIAGFSTTSPDREKAEDSGYTSTTIPTDSDSIIFWVELFGVHKSDHLSVVLYGPNLQQVVNQEEVLSGNKAVLFSFTGKRRGAVPWPKGTYSALFRLVRNGKIVIEERRDVKME
jgi:hypothetical protein